MNHILTSESLFEWPLCSCLTASTKEE